MQTTNSPSNRTQPKKTQLNVAQTNTDEFNLTYPNTACAEITFLSRQNEGNEHQQTHKEQVQTDVSLNFEFSIRNDYIYY